MLALEISDAYLRLKDAELALNQAKTNYTHSLFDYNISKSQLDKAIDGQINY